MESGWKNRLAWSGDLCGSNSICLRSSVGMIRDVADPGMDHSRACSICFGRRPIFDRKSVLKPECQAGIARPFCAFWGRHGWLLNPSRMYRSVWSLRSGADLLHKKTHNTCIVSLVSPAFRSISLRASPGSLLSEQRDADMDRFVVCRVGRPAGKCSRGGAFPVADPGVERTATFPCRLSCRESGRADWPLRHPSAPDRRHTCRGSMSHSPRPPCREPFPRAL